MAMTGRTIIGIFDEAGMADRTIDALQNAGFNDDQIYHSGRGAAGGGFWSGVKNFFTGNDTESATHVADDLEGMGVSDDEANYYENEYRNGHTILAVQAGNRAEEARSIMQTNGAYNYASRMGGTGITTTNADTTTANTMTTGRTSVDAANDINNANQTTDTVQPVNTTGYNNANYDNTQGATYSDTGTDEAQRLRLREEQLNVNKQRVQAGEVQLHKNVVEEQKTVNVPVTHEEVYVERRPVSGDVTDNTPIGEGEEIRVPVSEEQVNVNKNTVTTGEVAVGKRAVQQNQQVGDTVRREEATLDQSGNPRLSGTGLNNDVTNTDTTTNP